MFYNHQHRRDRRHRIYADYQLARGRDTLAVRSKWQAYYQGAGKKEECKIELTPRLILPLSLFYDHRLVDGADAARFLKCTVNALEQPLAIELEG